MGTQVIRDLPAKNPTGKPIHREPLGEGDYVVSADEKTSIQARVASV